MKIKEFIRLIKELDKYYASFPDWYWKHGVHDSEIKKITKSELPTDFQEDFPLYNCIEFDLDSTGALHERDICKIILYNYKIKTDQTFSTNEKIFWLDDTLTQLPNGRYMLGIHMVTASEKHMNLIITVDKAEAVRTS